MPWSQFPCTHGLDAHSSTSVSHWGPEYPATHSQWKLVSKLVHVPWFWHGFEVQGSNAAKIFRISCFMLYFGLVWILNLCFILACDQLKNACNHEQKYETGFTLKPDSFTRIIPLLWSGLRISFLMHQPFPLYRYPYPQTRSYNATSFLPIVGLHKMHKISILAFYSYQASATPRTILPDGK